MRLATFAAGGKLCYGIPVNRGVVDLCAMQLVLNPHVDRAHRLPSALLELVRLENAGIEIAREIAERAQELERRGQLQSPELDGVYLPLDRIVWQTPLPHTSRMFSLRGNNPILLRLDNLPMPQHPFLTIRYHGKLLGHGEPMVLRAVDGEIGWGAEFAVVLGRGGKGIKAAQAGAHILGYTAINDMNGSVFNAIAPDLVPRKASGHAADTSAPGGSTARYSTRDEQYAGKFYGTWSMPQPVGPWIVTADEIPNPYNLVVRSRESGLPCDTVTTAAMLLRFEEVIEFMSSFMTLKSGDIISSGALGWHTIPGRDYYPPGSTFEVEIERVGVLSNPIMDYRRAGRA